MGKKVTPGIKQIITGAFRSESASDIALSIFLKHGVNVSERRINQIRQASREADDESNRGRRDVPLGSRRKVDEVAVAAATRQLLIALGEDPDREGLVDTPARVSRYYSEFLGSEIERFTLFSNDEGSAGYGEILCVRDIPFSSLCEHHLLSFKGMAHVAYKPNGMIVGLSKLARVVDMFAGRLQLQEQLTNQIADFLYKHLSPQLVAVRIEAEHSCMSIRGVKKLGASTSSIAVRGQVSEKDRREVLDELKR